MIDVPLSIVGLTVWTVPYAILSNELQGPYCDPCDRSHVNPFDRLSIPLHNPSAATGADVLLYSLPPIYFAIRLLDYGAGNWRGYLVDAFVTAETVIWSGVVNEVERRLVRRARPFMYDAGVFPDERKSVESTLSFYSGHTSAIFAFSVSTAYGFTLRHPKSPWNWLMWIGLLSYSSTEGVLRVVSGDHFPTDVIVGALVGSGIGLIVPALHRRRGPLDSPWLTSLTLMPAQLPGGGMLSLGGAF